MENVIENMNKCTGCGTCKNVCPVSAIDMQVDSTGFLFPLIDQSKCISCKKCSKACPVENSPEPYPYSISYAAMNNDDKEREQSSSGGIFGLLAKYVIERRGTVFGAAYDHEYKVIHTRVDNLNYLDDLHGAKYSQSDLGDTFISVKNDLLTYPLVLFSGTPCQVAGLKKYLQNDYSNLITVDMVCHGVPSPKVWEKYVTFRMKSDKSDSLPSSINLRSKRTGWDHYKYSVEFKYNNGHHYQALSSRDPYMKAFVTDQIIRESCSDCKFKGLSRCSDFTLGDFWGIEQLHPEMTDNKGTSLIIIHSELGKKIWDDIKLFTEYKAVDAEDTYRENPSLIKSSKIINNRKKILTNTCNYGFAYLVYRNRLQQMKRRIISKVKKSEEVKKLGIVTITNNQNGNYGNTLQNYAVQQVLKKLGYESETIRNLKYIEQRRYKLLHSVKLRLFKDYRSKRNLKFEVFKQKHIKESKQYIGRGHEDYKLLNQTYYKFICGSDQIWNPNYRLNDNLYYTLLDFASPEKRIAYAASIGIDKLPEKVEEQYKNALSKFNSISVREESAADIVENLIGKRPVVLIDPTMMLSAEEWGKLAQPVTRLINSRFILKYCLGDTDELIENVCSKIKGHYAIQETVDLNDKGAVEVYGPAEFIWLIANAEHIITDSFHGTVFSVLFNKQFSVLKRKGEDDQIFSRLVTLLQLLKLESRVIGDQDSAIHFEEYNVQNVIDCEIEKAYVFLTKSING